MKEERDKKKFVSLNYWVYWGTLEQGWPTSHREVEEQNANPGSYLKDRGQKRNKKKRGRTSQWGTNAPRCGLVQNPVKNASQYQTDGKSARNH